MAAKASAEGPREVLNAKIRGDLRQRLNRSAETRGLSLSAEVERRLEASFVPMHPGLVGVSGIEAQFLTCMRRVIVEAEGVSGQKIGERDGDMARKVAGAGLVALVETFCGKPEQEPEQREDGSFSLTAMGQQLAAGALRDERLLKPHKGGGFAAVVGPGSYDDA